MAQRKKKRYSSGSGDDEDDNGEFDTSEAIEFSQPGSIKRLKFINFMQYTEVEFQCGPNLNVIIGEFFLLKQMHASYCLVLLLTADIL